MARLRIQDKSKQELFNEGVRVALPKGAEGKYYGWYGGNIHLVEVDGKLKRFKADDIKKAKGGRATSDKNSEESKLLKRKEKLNKLVAAKNEELQKIFSELESDPDYINSPDGSVPESTGYKDIVDKLQSQIDDYSDEIDSINLKLRNMRTSDSIDTIPYGNAPVSIANITEKLLDDYVKREFDAEGDEADQIKINMVEDNEAEFQIFESDEPIPEDKVFDYVEGSYSHSTKEYKGKWYLVVMFIDGYEGLTRVVDSAKEPKDLSLEEVEEREVPQEIEWKADDLVAAYLGVDEEDMEAIGEFYDEGGVDYYRTKEPITAKDIKFLGGAKRKIVKHGGYNYVLVLSTLAEPSNGLSKLKDSEESEALYSAKDYFHNEWDGEAGVLPFDLTADEVEELNDYITEMLDNEEYEEDYPVVTKVGNKIRVSFVENEFFSDDFWEKNHLNREDFEGFLTDLKEDGVAVYSGSDGYFVVDRENKNYLKNLKNILNEYSVSAMPNLNEYRYTLLAIWDEYCEVISRHTKLEDIILAHPDVQD